MVRMLDRVRTLRFKLTLSAAVTMIVAISLVTVAVVVQLSWADQRLLRQADVRGPLRAEMEGLARQLSPALLAGDPSEQAERWLRLRETLCDLGLEVDVPVAGGGVRPALLPLDRLRIADATGATLAERSSARAVDATGGAGVPVWARSTWLEAREGRAGVAVRSLSETPPTLLAAVPVVDATGAVRAVLVAQTRADALTFSVLAGRVEQMLRRTVPRAAPVALVVALVLAAWGSRGLVRRIARLRRATMAWARGDLALRVASASRDELGALAHDLDTMAGQLQTLLETRNRLAALEERTALARDLHDTVKQNVFSVSMLLASVESLLDRDPRQARDLLRQARASSEETGRELVSMIDQLRPDPVDRVPLADALDRLVTAWSSTHGIEVTSALGKVPDLPAAHAHHLLSIVREALTNVARHGRARTVEIVLGEERDAPAGDAVVRLTLRDDGVGFDPIRLDGHGFGLESMRSRLDALGGRVEVRSQLGAGTVVTAVCPVTHAGQVIGRSEAATGRDRAA